MNNIRSADFSVKLAKTISVIFHPFLIPVYGLVVIFIAPTLYYYIPFEVKKLIILIVLVNNILLPVSLMPFLVHQNIIESWFMNEKRDRRIPLIISTILYIVSTYLIFRFKVPSFLKSYFLAITFLSLSATMINFWWKISLHSIGAGAIVALVVVFSIRMYTPLLWYVIPVILAGGLILYSRLQLNLHNPGQVWSGFFTGSIGFALIAMLFQQLS
jgi:hypothetical protein